MKKEEIVTIAIVVIFDLCVLGVIYLLFRETNNPWVFTLMLLGYATKPKTKDEK
jgi:hypothetical protein